MTGNEISSKIIEAATEVHKLLGPGLLESTYEYCLVYELKQHGLEVKQHVSLPLIYKNVKLEAGYRIDLLVEDSVIVVIKTVNTLADIDMAQLLTYLKLKNVNYGLLINFNSVELKHEMKIVEMGA